jgi:hypothetical protein
MSSASLRYLMALQSHFLRLSVLHGEFPSDKEASGKSPAVEEQLHQILSLNAKILRGAYEVKIFSC